MLCYSCTSRQKGEPHVDMLYQNAMPQDQQTWRWRNYMMSKSTCQGSASRYSCIAFLMFDHYNQVFLHCLGLLGYFLTLLHLYPSQLLRYSHSVHWSVARY